MAYPIKATAGASSFPVLRVSTYGNLGVNQGGYGSTASTGFWNGKSPNLGGYIVYVGNLSSSPTMYVLADDSELITLSNTLGGGSNTTIGQALTYFLGINITCIDVEPPNVVTDGLYLYLDAGFSCSYPRIGTNWIDMGQGGGNTNGTLINGPVYVNDGGGAISFDGSDDYVNCGNDANLQFFSQITMSVWVKFFGLDYSSGTGELIGFMSKGYPDLSSPNTGFWFAYDNRSNGSSFNYTCFGNSAGGFAGGGNNFSSKSYTFTNNVWYNITATVNSSSQGTLYINGVQQGSSVTFNNLSIPNTTNNLYVGRLEVSGYSIYGNIMQTHLYNRVLTSTEVLQNYYAGLQRLITKNNLILWLDGENTNTRVITPTTAYDMSGLGYNGSLQNSMGLSHVNAGTSFYFDGVNDFINLGSPYRVTIAVSFLTVSVWFKINTTPTGSSPIIKFGGVGGGWLIGVTSAGLYYSLYTTSNTYVGGSVGPISLNTWYNVTFTFSGSAFVMYLNGVIVVNSVATAGTINNGGSTVVTVGRDSNSTFNWFNGFISIVRIYAETLTATEVLTIYTAGKGRHGL